MSRTQGIATTGARPAILLPGEGHIFALGRVEFLRGSAVELIERPAG